VWIVVSSFGDPREVRFLMLVDVLVLPPECSPFVRLARGALW